MTSLEQYLYSVKKRLSAAMPGYSLGRIVERNNWCINIPGPPSDSGLEKWPLCEFYGGDIDPKADVDLLLSAPTDLERMVRIIEVIRKDLALYAGEDCDALRLADSIAEEI